MLMRATAAAAGASDGFRYRLFPPRRPVRPPGKTSPRTGALKSRPLVVAYIASVFFFARPSALFKRQ